MSADESRGEFVDTNILIYAFDRSAGEKHHIAVDLVTRLWTERRGWISLQVMQEFYVAATRKLKLPVDEAALQVRRLGLWRVHRPLVDDILAAIELHQRHSVSFWDVLICAARRLLSVPLYGRRICRTVGGGETWRSATPS